jgi:hypothetical protein
LFATAGISVTDTFEEALVVGELTVDGLGTDVAELGEDAVGFGSAADGFGAEAPQPATRETARTTAAAPTKFFPTRHVMAAP